jgi:hypothetical protein
MTADMVFPFNSSWQYTNGWWLGQEPQHAEKQVAVGGTNYTVKYEYGGFCSVPATYPPGAPHYGAVVSVWRGGRQVGTNILGTYVPGGCFEDVPSEWVAKALAAEASKPQQASDRDCHLTNCAPPFGTNYMWVGAIKGKSIVEIYASLHVTYIDGLEVWEQATYETNWVTLWTDSWTNHQCGVVTSNWCLASAWEGRTNFQVLKSAKLKLPQPPQRDESESSSITVSNIMYIPTTNYYFSNPSNYLWLQNTPRGM